VGLAVLNEPDNGGIELSVVVNNYNYENYLAEALDSALAQIGDGDEIVVVDDGSTDGSKEVLDRYRSENRIRIVVQENQRQLAAVLNGLALSRGEVCVLLDSDDYLLPGYLDRLRNLQRTNPDIELFFSAAEIGGASRDGIRNMQQVMGAMELPEGPTGLTRWSTWAGGEFVGTPTSGLALRRSLVERFISVRGELPDRMPIGKRTARFLGIPAHSHTGVRISADGIIVRGSSVMGCRKYYCPTPAFHYRIHGGNAFATLSTVARLYIRMQRSRQIARLTARAIEASRHPRVDEVLSEAAGRSRPLRLRRRLRLWVNYAQALCLATDPVWRRFTALCRLPFRLFREGPTKAQSGTQ
jgi:glycosyltransferase involved in cell wall biosynthesis